LNVAEETKPYMYCLNGITSQDSGRLHTYHTYNTDSVPMSTAVTYL